MSRRPFNFAPIARTRVMGIVNVTPDSFSEGGAFFEKEKAVAHALAIAAAGADIIDIGGESTRPGARDVSVDEEIARVAGVIEAVAAAVPIPISIDTRKAPVAEAAISAGASIVNDVSALRHDPAIASVAARHGAGLVLMHMQGTPQSMQVAPHYDDLIGEIVASLTEAVAKAEAAGVAGDRIAVDPGIGFGKAVAHNLAIINRLEAFATLGKPVCIGISRKSFIGAILGIDEPRGRLVGTLAACAAAIMRGAGIIRVHDVAEAVQAARIVDSIIHEKAVTP